MLSQVNMRVMRGAEVREIWFLFETQHPDLFEFNEDLASDGTVYGERIETIAEGSDRRETGRYEFILGVEAVLSVMPAKADLLPPRAEA